MKKIVILFFFFFYPSTIFAQLPKAAIREKTLGTKIGCSPNVDPEEDDVCLFCIINKDGKTTECRVYTCKSIGGIGWCTPIGKTTEAWDLVLPGYGATGGETPADYDGDGKADISLHTGGNWYIDYASNGFGSWNVVLPGYGATGGETPADYDGDGKADISLLKDGILCIDYASNGFGSWDVALPGYGTIGKEAPADYNGDGKTDIGLHENSNWYIKYKN